MLPRVKRKGYLVGQVGIEENARRAQKDVYMHRSEVEEMGAGRSYDTPVLNRNILIRSPGAGGKKTRKGDELTR